MLDCEKVTHIDELFGVSRIETLTDLGGFLNLQVSLYDSLDHLPNLTVQSIMNVIDHLYGFLGPGFDPRYLDLGTINLNKLTDEQKAVATNKGWVLR